MTTRGRILVVDDAEEIREMLSDFLSRLHFAVDTAGDGQEALQKYMHGGYDVIISDVFMPHMDGIEFLKHIRSLNKDIMFLMITGYPDVETAVEAIKEGAYDYITKPFNMEDVRLRIERAFEKKSLKERLKTVEGFNWALLISIPLWLLLGIILTKLLKS